MGNQGPAMFNGGFERPALVVAHPDDESLWGAGIVIRYPGDWLVVCCTTPYSDPERIDKFLLACDVLGAEPYLLHHPERNGLIPLPDLSGRDFIVTHGPNGEYGHPQHRELNARLPNKSAWFAYGDKSDFTIDLTDSEWQQKLAALQCYDHVSVTDRRPKWEALLDYYGRKYDLKREPYGLPNAAADGS